jgi:hypothetical protein
MLLLRCTLYTHTPFCTLKDLPFARAVFLPNPFTFCIFCRVLHGKEKEVGDPVPNISDRRLFGFCNEILAITI